MDSRKISDQVAEKSHKKNNYLYEETGRLISKQKGNCFKFADKKEAKNQTLGVGANSNFREPLWGGPTKEYQKQRPTL